MTNAAIDSGPFGDIYVSMGEPVDNGALDHPRVFEAVHHVGVVRLHHDGDRRLPRAVGPSLPHGAERDDAPARAPRRMGAP